MQSCSTGRSLAIAILTLAAFAVLADPSAAQSTSGRTLNPGPREIEHVPPVPVSPVTSAKEPDTDQDRTEHQERIEREKAGLDYDRRIAEAVERQANAADQQIHWALWQVAIGALQALILLAILMAVLRRKS